MGCLFTNCYSLISLPDISNWKVNDIFLIFSNCISLISLPDISKWNNNNIMYMKYLFTNCFSLSFLPDITKWKYYNEKDINETVDYSIINGLSNIDMINAVQFATSQEEYEKLSKDYEILAKQILKKFERLYIN